MERFRGGFPATIDGKGRVKLPSKLREQLEEQYGREVYVCSFAPHELRIYPLGVWEDYEERLATKPDLPAVLRHKERLSYGQLIEVDDHGRILVPALLREMVDVGGEVVVSGRTTYITITRRERAASILKESAPSDEELEALARLEL